MSSSLMPAGQRAPPHRGDLRVGGGYSVHGGVLGSPSPRRQGRRPEKPRAPISTMIKEFPAKGVTALEVLQGGATVWTAESDGSINVRNAFTGEVATSSKPEAGQEPVTLKPQGEAIIVRLFATDTQMWAGLNDGSVRMYDHLVVVQVWPEAGATEPKPHSTSVEFFCALYDGTVLSGDIEGNLVKWVGEQPDDDGRASDILCRGFSNGTGGDGRSLSALDTNGTFVYTGDRSGMMYVLAADDLRLVHSWDTNHGSVTAVRFMDGMLFTGGSGCTVRIWQQASQKVPTEPLKEVTLGAPVSRLIPDLRAHLIWAVDKEGAVTKMESTAPFSQRTEGELRTGPFSDIATFTTWDAVRVWSTGSNGANFAWFAQWSRAEEQMQEAIEGMESIIEQDGQQLDKWQGLIDQYTKMDQDRKDKLVRALAANTDQGLSHIYYRKWLLWLRRLHAVRSRSRIAGCLARNTRLGLLNVYYGRLMRHWQQHKILRQKRAMCENVMATTTKGLRRIYWRKIDDYRHRKKKEVMRRRLGESLLQTTEHGLLRKYLRKTMRYLDRMRIQTKRQEYASVLLRSTDSGLRRVYYYKLARWIHWVARRRRRDAIGRAMLVNSQRGMQRVYYRKFCTWGESLKHQRQKKELADALRRSTARGLLAAYQAKCDLWLENHRREQLHKRIDERKGHLADLKEREKAMQDRMKRRRALEELRKRKEKLEQDKADLEGTLAKLKEEQGNLEEAQRKKMEHVEDLRKKALTLDDAMSQLKEMALNFDADYDTIQKNSDRCASTSAVAAPGAAKPVISQFLQAHMNVKSILTQLKEGKVVYEENYWPADRALMRTVLEKWKEGEEEWKELLRDAPEDSFKNPPWNLDGRFTKLQNFQYNVIGPAIKTMVILYDMMTKADKDRITTDEEIVINAENIMHLCTNAGRVKEKRAKKDWSDGAWTAQPDGWTPWEKQGVPAWVKDSGKSMVELWKQVWSEFKGQEGAAAAGS
eukprot:TRINITY_DN759_c2_g1_i1.p1 TRINITY_DN759_c2_g1~~TRINITY_DN759_c2_g1_i1.p1  ORF type:complete len:985 (+),score=377.22 TRINITY_DN759_c2_g1_i1:82-3036(+)